jgi:hypothetical protein
MAQQSNKVLEVPASLVGNDNLFDDDAIALATASILNPSFTPDDNAARGPLKYPPVEPGSNQLSRATRYWRYQHR